MNGAPEAWPVPLANGGNRRKAEKFGNKIRWAVLISSRSIARYLKHHLCTAVVDYVCEPVVRLSKRAGLPLQVVQSIRQSLICQFGSYPVSGRELWEEESARHRLISSGCPGLDKLMGGGVVTGQLTEVCGPPASGKTQVVTVLLVGRWPLGLV